MLTKEQKDITVVYAQDFLENHPWIVMDILDPRTSEDTLRKHDATMNKYCEAITKGVFQRTYRPEGYTIAVAGDFPQEFYNLLNEELNVQLESLEERLHEGRQNA